MAVAQYSKRIGLQLGLVVFLGWCMLLLWAISQWIFYGYANAYNRINTLTNTQRAAITPVYQNSLLSIVPFTYKPIENISLPYSKILASNPFLSDLIQKTQQLGQIILKSCQCLLIKLMVLFSALPLFALSMLAGLVDGLNQRAIRTACLGRESSYLFHRFSHYLKKFLLLLLMVWLALPISINPAAIFIPISLMMAFMVAMTASRFKKYL